MNAQGEDVVAGVRTPQTIDQLAGDLHALLVDTASGRETKAELLGYTETAVMRACNYV